MKIVRAALLLVALTLSFSVLSLGDASAAWNPFGGIDCGADAGQGSAVCEDSKNGDDPLGGSDGLIMNITNLVALVAGVVAVIIIVLSALRFVTSNGSAEDISGARRALIYSLVGLIVIILARTLVAFVVSKL